MIKKQPGDEIKITDENFTKVCAAVLQHIRESKLGAYKAWSHDKLATITIVVKEDKLAHLLRDQKLTCAGVDDEPCSTPAYAIWSGPSDGKKVRRWGWCKACEERACNDAKQRRADLGLRDAEPAPGGH